MRVVVPYTNLRDMTRGSVERFWPAADFRSLSGDTALFELWQEVWARGEDVLWIEHDVVPTIDVALDAPACGAGWCTWGYDYARFGVYYGTGCVRIRGAVMRAFPDLWDRVALMGDDVHPPKHWCALDARMQAELTARGFQMHRHGVLEHLGVGVSHGCV